MAVLFVVMDMASVALLRYARVDSSELLLAVDDRNTEEQVSVI